MGEPTCYYRPFTAPPQSEIYKIQPNDHKQPLPKKKKFNEAKTAAP